MPFFLRDASRRVQHAVTRPVTRHGALSVARRDAKRDGAWGGGGDFGFSQGCGGRRGGGEHRGWGILKTRVHWLAGSERPLKRQVIDITFTTRSRNLATRSRNLTERPHG